MKVIKTIIKNIVLFFLCKVLTFSQYAKLSEKICDTNSIVRFFWGCSDVKRAGSLNNDTHSYSDGVEIVEGDYSYQYFNFCFLGDMLSRVCRYISEGKTPIINVVDKEGNNIWEMFFEQPIVSKDVVITQKDNKKIRISPQWNDVYDHNAIEMWGKVVEKYVRFNKKTKEYIDKEYNEILLNKRVLGVILRGTDYEMTKPQGHPIQPDIVEVIEKIKEFKKKYSFEYIYLATEDGRIKVKMQEAFPNMILTNKRMYYDEIFIKNECNLIKDVHFNRENDDYFKGLEYLSSIYLVSKCDFLIAGNCGGTQLAVFMNNNQYKDSHIYNKGLYK